MHTPRVIEACCTLSHKNIEIRRCWTISDRTYALYAQNSDFRAKLHSLVKVVSERRVADKIIGETRYYKVLNV